MEIKIKQIYIYNIPAKVYKQKIKIKIKEHCTIVIKN